MNNNIINSHYWIFNNSKCLSGVTFRYLYNLDNVEDISYINSTGDYLYNMYSEYHLIDKFMSNVSDVDIAIDYNINTGITYYELDDLVLKPNHKVLLFNQDVASENNVYYINDKYSLKVSDDLLNNERYQTFCKSGKYKDMEFFLEPSGFTYPTIYQDKYFITGQSYILKYVVDYDINKEDYLLQSPKIVFIDYETARYQLSNLFNYFDKILYLNSDTLYSGETYKIRYQNFIYDVIIDDTKSNIYTGVTYDGLNSNIYNDTGSTYIQVDSSFGQNIGDYLYLKIYYQDDQTLFLEDKLFIENVLGSDLISVNYIPNSLINTISNYTGFSYEIRNLNYSSNDLNDLIYCFNESYFNTLLTIEQEIDYSSITYETNLINDYNVTGDTIPTDFEYNIYSGVTTSLKSDMSQSLYSNIFLIEPNSSYQTDLVFNEDISLIGKKLHLEVEKSGATWEIIADFENSGIKLNTETIPMSWTNNGFDNFISSGAYTINYAYISNSGRTAYSDSIEFNTNESDIYYLEISNPNYTTGSENLEIYLISEDDNIVSNIVELPKYGGYIGFYRIILTSIYTGKVKVRLKASTEFSIFFELSNLNVKTYKSNFKYNWAYTGTTIENARLHVYVSDGGSSLTTFNNADYLVLKQNYHPQQTSTYFSPKKTNRNYYLNWDDFYFYNPFEISGTTGTTLITNVSSFESKNSYAQYKLQPFLQNLNSIFINDYILYNEYTLNQSDFVLDTSKLSEGYLIIKPNDVNELVNFETFTFIEFSSTTITDYSLIVSKTDDSLIISKPNNYDDILLTGDFSFRNVGKLGTISDILHYVYTNYNDKIFFEPERYFYNKISDNFRRKISEKYASILKNDINVQNNSTGLLYVNNEGNWVFEIYNLNRDQNLDPEDSFLTYKPVELLFVGRDRKTRSPIFINPENII